MPENHAGLLCRHSGLWFAYGCVCREEDESPF